MADMGYLFTAPVGANFDSDWAPLGWAEECGLGYATAQVDPVGGAEIIRSRDGRCMALAMPIKSVSPRAFALMFNGRARHPRLAAMRRAYRGRVSSRRGTRR